MLTGWYYRFRRDKLENVVATEAMNVDEQEKSLDCFLDSVLDECAMVMRGRDG